MTTDEFASKIKAKHPQYSKMDNKDLAKKVLDKYPQYRSQVQDISSPFPQESIAKQAVSSAISPLMPQAHAKAIRGWQGLPPKTQRAIGYGAAATVLPEIVGGEALAAGLSRPAYYGSRALAGGIGSAISDVGTGNPINKLQAGLTGGSEALGYPVEKGIQAIKPYIPMMAEKFANVSKPVIEMASKYGNKFGETFPGTTEAIQKGASKVAKYYGDVSGKIKGAREAIFNSQAKNVAEQETKYATDVANHEKLVNDMKNAYAEAKKTAISQRDRKYIEGMEGALKSHSEKIKGLSGELSDKAQQLDKSGRELRSAAFKRGINVDPIEELKTAKIGPVQKGTKHELGLALPSRMPSELTDLEVRLKGYLHSTEPVEKKLVEAVKLKRAFQDVLHVQGNLNYAEKEAVNAYTKLLDKEVGKLDPAYHALEKNFHNSLNEYDRLYDKSKRIFDDLREGSDIPIPRESLPKASEYKPAEVPEPQYPEPPQKPNIQQPKMIKASPLENRMSGQTPGDVTQTLNKLMHPSSGSEIKTAEETRRISRAPGAEEAMGNIARKEIHNPFTRRMIYPMARLGAGVATAPLLLSKSRGKKALGGLGSGMAIASLLQASLQSPALYEFIVTHPEMIKALLTRTPGIVTKAGITASQ